MPDSVAALRARNLRTLALLAGLFLLPLLLAFCTYYGSSWRPGNHVNHGVLVTPPRPLPAVRLRQVLPPAGARGARAVSRAVVARLCGRRQLRCRRARRRCS